MPYFHSVLFLSPLTSIKNNNYNWWRYESIIAQRAIDTRRRCILFAPMSLIHLRKNVKKCPISRLAVKEKIRYRPSTFRRFFFFHRMKTVRDVVLAHFAKVSGYRCISALSQINDGWFHKIRWKLKLAQHLRCIKHFIPCRKMMSRATSRWNADKIKKNDLREKRSHLKL